MEKRKKWLFLVLAFALVLSLPLSNAAEAENAVTLKFHTVAPADDYMGKAVAVFVERAKELSNGTLIIKPFYFGQLGGEREAMDMAKMGVLDALIVSEAVMGAFVPGWKSIGLPFLTKSREHFKQSMASDAGKDLFSASTKRGFITIGIAMNAFKCVTNNVRPITSPKSFKGLKMRTQETPVQMDTMKALGATATPIPFPELYTALQTGVVEGQMNEYGATYTRKFYEVQKYLTEMPIFISSNLWLVSRKTWDKLSPEHQRILKRTMEEGVASIDREAPAEQNNFKRLIAESGKIQMNVLDRAEYPRFREMLRPVYDLAAKRDPEIVPFMEYLLAH